MAENKQIIEKVGVLFKKYGIKSITMDDVARELGMSKKTLYQIVADKNQLIELVLVSDLKILQNKLNELDKEKDDAVLHFIRIQQLICTFLSTMSLAVNYDLRKYHFAIFDSIRDKYLQLFRNTISGNIRDGKVQGIYRDEINEDIITKFHLNLIDQIPDSALISIDEFTSESIVNEICTYHMNGLVNEQGRKLITKYKDNIETINKPVEK